MELTSFAETPLETAPEVLSPAAPPPPPENPDASVSALTAEDKAKLGHQLQAEIVEDGQHVMARYLRIGRNLRLVVRNKLYEPLGFASPDEWRAQPEMNLSRSTSYALMRVHEVFIERLRVEPERLRGLDYSKLYSVSHLVDGDNIDDFLEKVRSLSRADLQREVTVERAKRKGLTVKEAEVEADFLDTARQCCPVRCGNTCAIINGDNDAAVAAFKKFLGGWKSLSARIKGLYGKSIATQDEATPAPPGPTETDPPDADTVRQPSACKPDVPEPQDGEGLHGQGPDPRSGPVAGVGGSAGEAGSSKVWA